VGLYPIDCPSCHKPFVWFSGTTDQRCPDCRCEVIQKVFLQSIDFHTSHHNLGNLGPPAEVEIEDFSVGDLAMAVETLEGFITESKIYKVEWLRPEEGRIVITDDRGLEGWYKSTRFIKVIDSMVAILNKKD